MNEDMILDNELLTNIKNDILKTQYKIMENANLELINLYFRIGKIISENTKYGNKFIEIISTTLKLEFPNTTFMKNTKISTFCHHQWQNCHGHIIIY